MPRKKPQPLTSINIAGKTYSITYEDEIIESGYLCDGVTCIADATIKIAKGMDAVHTKQILLHEIVHALLNDSGAAYLMKQNIENKEEFEETLVRVLTPVLMEVIKQIGYYYV
jgi:hypothetical protein